MFFREPVFSGQGRRLPAKRPRNVQLVPRERVGTTSTTVAVDTRLSGIFRRSTLLPSLLPLRPLIPRRPEPLE